MKPINESIEGEVILQTSSSRHCRTGFSRVIGSFVTALFILVIPFSYLLAIATTIGLHFLGALSLHHWSFADWIVTPARFVLLCYPLLIPGAALLAAGLSSDQVASGTLILIAVVWGLFCGIIIAWFPDPAAALFHKGIRAAYAVGFATLCAAWVHSVRNLPRGPTSRRSGPATARFN